MAEPGASNAHSAPAPTERALMSAAPIIPANRYILPRGSYRFFPMLGGDEHHPRVWVWPPYLDSSSAPWLGVLRELYTQPAMFPASLSPEAGLMLFSLVRNLRPRLVVEVGTYLGVSTIWMAAGLEAAGVDPPSTRGASNRHKATASDSQMTGHVHNQAPADDMLSPIIHCFDNFDPMPPGPWRDAGVEQDRDRLVLEALARAGLGHRAALHKGDSSTQITAARDSLRAAGGVDFALIDGDHSEDGALKDLWAIEPVLNTGGYLLLHDIYPEQCGGHAGPRHIIEQVRQVAQGVYECCELYTAPLNYGMALLRRIG
jgi:predicted O-methyltransferase YrrM